MPVCRIEALADSIGQLNGISDPASIAYQTRNLGLLRAFSLRTLAATTKDCTRIFGAFQGGYRAILTDLERKCKGESHARGKDNKVLSGDSKIIDILWSLGIRHSLRYNKPVEQAIEFLRIALNDASIDDDTPLKYFLEKETPNA
jgi:hypothetical protein